MYLLLPLLPAVVLSGLVLRYDLLAWSRRPIDSGATFRGRRLFGDNKTWRGAVCMVAGCILTVALQKYVVKDRAGDWAVIDYGQANIFGLGMVLGGGAVLGELSNSFVKRQLGIAPGEAARGLLAPAFYLWDQVDSLFAIWPLLLFWVWPGGPLVLISFVVLVVAHQLISLLGYLLGMRQSIR
jgi:CDP-2,3-bis-(O-geranylgeranyl)-sn-glycerol synthase